MPLTFLPGSTNSLVTITNGDELVVRDFMDIFVVGTAVTFASGTAETGILNHGDIYGYLGLNVNSDSSRIVNYGTISGIRAASESGDAINLGGTGGQHVITNTGTITAEGHLIETDEATASINILFDNHGTGITERDIIAFSSQLGYIWVNNTGHLQGNNLNMSGSGSAQLVNTGTLLATAVVMSADFGAKLFNHGIISGRYDVATIYGSNVNDRVTNSGLIDGRISFLDGDDRYAAADAGLVTGYVDGGNGNDTLTGGSADDELRGGGDQDLLVGRDGEDTLEGGTGNDMMLGGAGNDHMTGGNNNDTLNGNSGDDTLEGGAGNDVLVGQDGSDLLDGGALDDILDGGNGDDVLEGGSGNDILRGRAGEDDLAGGLGLDLLTGGQGADNFVFRSLAETVVGANRDQILDFEQGLDSIVVAGLSPGVFEFRGTAAFAPSGNPELRLFETPTGSTIVQLDVNGDGIQDAEIRVANVTGLTAQDFVL